MQLHCGDRDVTGLHSRSASRTSARMTAPKRLVIAAQAVHPEDGAAISARGVKLSFKSKGATKQVLRGVDLSVPRGSFHMLLGANGCGKSTLLRALAGLLRPDAGTLTLDRPHAMVFQNPDHQVVLPTVGADVAFGLGRYRLSPEEVGVAVTHALDRVGLAGYAERPTSSLSGGQKQRVAIAGALSENPRVLLLDELTTFLDWGDQAKVLRCVRRIVDESRASSSNASSRGDAGGMAAPRSSGSGSGSDSGDSSDNAGGTLSTGNARQQAFDNPVTALWVTHRLEELDYADSVSFMDNGKVVFTGRPAEARGLMRRLGAPV